MVFPLVLRRYNSNCRRFDGVALLASEDVTGPTIATLLAGFSAVNGFRQAVSSGISHRNNRFRKQWHTKSLPKFTV